MVSGSPPKPGFAPHALSHGRAEPVSEVEVFLAGERRRAGLYERTGLHPGQGFAGPAIVAQDDCTTVVPIGSRAEVDAWGNLVIRPEG